MLQNGGKRRGSKKGSKKSQRGGVVYCDKYQPGSFITDPNTGKLKFIQGPLTGYTWKDNICTDAAGNIILPRI